MAETAVTPLHAQTPLSFPLSAFQQQRLTGLSAEQQKIQALYNEGLTAIIGATHDPATFTGWDIRVVNDAIVCTPPQEG